MVWDGFVCAEHERGFTEPTRSEELERFFELQWKSINENLCAEIQTWEVDQMGSSIKGGRSGKGQVTRGKCGLHFLVTCPLFLVTFCIDLSDQFAKERRFPRPAAPREEYDIAGLHGDFQIAGQHALLDITTDAEVVHDQRGPHRIALGRQRVGDVEKHR